MAKKSIELPVLELESEHSEETAPSLSQHAKTIQLGLGVDMLGSRMSLSATRGNTLEIHSYGVIAVSGKNGRRILIPWSNIKGVELLNEIPNN